jgi:hypothetical protein
VPTPAEQYTCCDCTERTLDDHTNAQVAVKASNDVTLSVPATAAALNTTTSSTNSSSSSSSTAIAAHLLRPLRAPLFSLEIAAVGDKGSQKFAYSHKLQGFSEAALAALDRGLAATQGVVRIERRVMKKLFWSHDPVMANVHGTAHWVQELRSEVSIIIDVDKLAIAFSMVLLLESLYCE